MGPDLDISGLHLFLTAFLIVLNGFFVAAEFAIVKVRSSQIEIQPKSRKSITSIARTIVHHLDDYLAATQLGITLASLGLGWIGEGVMTHLVLRVFTWIHVDIANEVVKTIGYTLAFISITVMHIVFGELAPKSFAIQRPVATTMVLALPLHLFYLVFRPLILVLNGLANIILKLFAIPPVVGYDTHHSSEELQYLLAQSEKSGALASSEHQLIKNVFDFNERLAKNIMVPRTKMSAIEIHTSKDDLLTLIISEGYSRIPVYEENIDKIVGIVHAKDILPLLAKGKDFALSDIIRKPYFVPETKKISALMPELQLKRIQIAIVLDEFGGTAGMITLEDIVEELVGEIQDEYDEENPIVNAVSSREFIVNALASVHDVNNYLPCAIPEDPSYDTVSGWLGGIFGRIPDVGEQEQSNGYYATILKKSEHNVESVKLELLADPSDADQD